MAKKKKIINKILLSLTALVAITGLADSTYLTYSHFSGRGVICDITHGCEQVLTSKYSVIAGVPVALLGVVFYLAVLMFTVHFLWHSRDDFRWLTLIGLIGFGSSLYFFSLQAFVIHSWCQYCLLSAASATTIFIFSLILYFANHHRGGESVEEE